MITIVGWYKKRPGPTSTRNVSMDTGWKQPEWRQYRVTLSAHADGEHLHLEFPYRDARRIIDAWQRSMAEYPEPKDTT